MYVCVISVVFLPNININKWHYWQKDFQQWLYARLSFSAEDTMCTWECKTSWGKKQKHVISLSLSLSLSLTYKHEKGHTPHRRAAGSVKVCQPVSVCVCECARARVMRECGMPRACRRVVSCVCVCVCVCVLGWGMGRTDRIWCNTVAELNDEYNHACVQAVYAAYGQWYIYYNYIIIFKMVFVFVFCFVCLLFKNDFTTTAMHSGYMTDMLVSRYFHRATDIPPLQSAPCICIQKRVVTSLESALILIRFLSMRRQ